MKYGRYRHLKPRHRVVVHLPEDYERRNRHLKILGFESYPHYLRSQMWQTIRAEVLARDQHSCCVCNERATDVHHNSYEIDVLVGKDLPQLVSLCRKDHEAVEFGDQGKNSLVEARNLLKAQGLSVPDLQRLPLPQCCIERDNKEISKNVVEEHVPDAVEIKQLRRVWYHRSRKRDNYPGAL